jgi:hypothetical protein
MLVAIGSATVPQPADAVSPAGAAGIGLGAFALGSVLANPYYHSYYYPHRYPRTIRLRLIIRHTAVTEIITLVEQRVQPDFSVSSFRAASITNCGTGPKLQAVSSSAVPWRSCRGALDAAS